ncbi:HupE/UreJ family protein [Brevundimonas denitrificans]|uniref:HupE/UreJ family protein n=1 Tax=Brevundimonas denitrificans TaxID=1443434 RepID=UPI0023B8F44E
MGRLAEDARRRPSARAARLVPQRPADGRLRPRRADGDKGYIQETSGFLFWPFLYLGAKHMVTGYDHLLFLLGVIFFLYRMKDISIYVTLFAIGHSSTLLLGVLTDISVSSYLVDAIIGLSVVYKALDNMGAYQRWFGFQPNTKVATWCSACSTASAWRPSSRTSTCRPTA